MRVAIAGVGSVLPVDGQLSFGTLPASVAARAARAERISQLALVAAHAALTDAEALCTEGPPRPEVGVVLGTAFGCFLTNAAHQQRLVDGGAAGVSPRLFAATVSNAAAGELTIAYRLGGPNVTLTAGLTSGLAAVAHAADLLGRGQAIALLAGGVDAVGEPLLAWIADGGLAIDRPAAEGAAVLLLETAASAHRRENPPRAWLLGWAVGFDARGDGTGRRAVMAGALARAEVSHAQLAHVLLPESDAGEMPGSLGARGMLRLLFLLSTLSPGDRALLVDTCASGHVAAVVVQRDPLG